jgi:acyl-CoA synthetase (NDP forming)/RimJ/RimL family protein N-acetyltransferase
LTALSEAGCSYALLADGTTITIRPARADDYQAVKRLHEAMSQDNLYLRFFSMNRQAAEQEARRVSREEGPGHGALLGFLGDELVGVASYESAPGAGTAEPESAEVAFAVADGMHGRGVATLMLEHLVSLAREQGVRVFTASALPENNAMLRVFADAGLTVTRRLDDGVVELSMSIPRSAALSEPSPYLDAVAGREQRADVASLEPLFAPRSVAVVGASDRAGSVGRAILLNIRDAGFAGALHAVNPHAADIEGIPSVPSPAALPGAPDLAVVTVPAAAVLGVARECGQRGARSLVVITTGLTSAQSAGLLDTCRRWGMRLVGPNCFGVAVPRLGLNATFAAHQPLPGSAGLVVQSGGVGGALLAHFSRLGIGVSSFASVGDKLDVSGNDVLQWWAHDGTTRLGVLYLESFGNPRKFARTAARVSATMPVLTVHAGRSAPGQRAAASHTAAAAAPLITRQALFEQAGIIATTSFGELLEAAVLLASQPVPAGTRVGIISNAGGAGVLTADACVEAGLSVATPGPAAQAQLAGILPAGAATGGPVDTTAAVSARAFGAALATLAGDAGVDAVIALPVRTAVADLIRALCAARLPVPLAVVMLDQPESVQVLRGRGEDPDAPGDQEPPGRRADQVSPAGQAAPAGQAIPSYAYPESAARALARAARYGMWRSRPADTVPELAGIRTAEARTLIASFLDRMPGGGWMPADEADRLLRCYQLPMVESRLAVTADEAAAAAADLGGPVALKAEVPGLVHKSEAGAVLLGLDGPGATRAGFAALAGRFAGDFSGALVQPMIPDGTEVIIGVVQEPVFGPLVVFGLGGVATEFLGDHAARLAPLTGADADDLIHSIRAAPLLLGHRGQPPADVAALRDALLRVSRLADDLPQVAELDLNPVIARPDGVTAVDARIRVTSHGPADPFLRQLPVRHRP